LVARRSDSSPLTISGSRLRVWFFVELGAAIKAAAAIVPLRTIGPHRVNIPLTSVGIFSLSFFQKMAEARDRGLIGHCARLQVQALMPVTRLHPAEWT